MPVLGGPNLVRLDDGNMAKQGGIEPPPSGLESVGYPVLCLMARREGFEPSCEWVRATCLSTWLPPTEMGAFVSGTDVFNPFPIRCPLTGVVWSG